jgi:hypothetical protein
LQDSVIPIAGLIHLVPFGFEHHAEIIANVALVIDNQNVNLRLSHRTAPFLLLPDEIRDLFVQSA